MKCKKPRLLAAFIQLPSAKCPGYRRVLRLLLGRADPAEEHMSSHTPFGHSSLKFPSGFYFPTRERAREAGLRRLRRGFGKGPTDHTRCDDGVVPLICPTCQMVSQDASGSTPAIGGYFAWGCFRYFCCPVTEASDRTQSHHAL